jgi:hypothetical protein
MPNVYDDDEESLRFADESEWMQDDEERGRGTDLNDPVSA